MSPRTEARRQSQHPEFVHQAGIYATLGELVALVEPFLHEGVAAGEPTLVALDPRRQQALDDALGDLTGLTVVNQHHYERPLATLHATCAFLTDLLQEGAGRLRLISELPTSLISTTWDDWLRHEALINNYYALLPLQVLCLYDRRTSPDVLDDVHRLHPYLTTDDHTARANPAYADPGRFLAQQARTEVDPLEHRLPDLDIVDPVPAAARQDVAALAQCADLHRDTVDDFVLAVSEALTNAIVHGRPPVRLRGWAAADRCLVTVRDHGHGPTDPYLALLPPRDATVEDDGYGLWVAHQTTHRLTLVPEEDGFTVRLTVRTPPSPS